MPLSLIARRKQTARIAAGEGQGERPAPSGARPAPGERPALPEARPARPVQRRRKESFAAIGDMKVAREFAHGNVAAQWEGAHCRRRRWQRQCFRERGAVRPKRRDVHRDWQYDGGQGVAHGNGLPVWPPLPAVILPAPVKSGAGSYSSASRDEPSVPIVRAAV